MPSRKKKTKIRTIDDYLSELEKSRNSKVIVYATGEKQPVEHFGTQVALDILPYFKTILESYGKKVNKITLAINTNGGLIETPWPLVNLIREYCNQFEIIVLEKSLSAGTMIALGGDRIVMFPFSHISPIDPARSYVDGDKQKIERIEIEDVIGYIDFIKEKVGLSEQNALAEAIKELTKETRPTVLGSINRTHALIRRLAKLLLETHAKRLPEKQIREIVENLTQKLFSHGHLINRREAKEMIGFGSIIEFGREKDKELSDEILGYIKKITEFDKVFDPATVLNGSPEKKFELPRACILSLENKFNFVSSYHLISAVDSSGKTQIALNNTKNNWKKI